jgi:hypothetical protein
LRSPSVTKGASDLQPLAISAEKRIEIKTSNDAMQWEHIWNS